MTDLHDQPHSVARRIGATEMLNIVAEPRALERYEADRGHFDLVFECSAAAPAIEAAIRCIRPLGRIVQVGVAGALSVANNALVGKEIALMGTLRFHSEFAGAVGLIDSGAIDVSPIITYSFARENLAAGEPYRGVPSCRRLRPVGSRRSCLSPETPQAEAACLLVVVQCQRAAT